MSGSIGIGGDLGVETDEAIPAAEAVTTRRIRAVVLDWAGTTQDYGSQAPVGAFIEVFARNGVTITTAQARGPMGIYKLDHIRAIATLPDVAARWQKVHGSACTEDDVHSMYLELVPIQEAVLPRFCTLIPGTVEAMPGR